MVDKHAPLLECRVKHAKQPEWFSEDIKQAMFLCGTYASTNDEENMKHWQNKTTELMRKAKSTYYHELINASLKNGKKTLGVD